eukprot:scaffold2404_cov398-Prasinococcus_capsulatus_cf.AAC.3
MLLWTRYISDGMGYKPTVFHSVDIFKPVARYNRENCGVPGDTLWGWFLPAGSDLCARYSRMQDMISFKSSARSGTVATLYGYELPSLLAVVSKPWELVAAVRTQAARSFL